MSGHPADAAACAPPPVSALSAVYVTFDDAAEVSTARARVFERLQQARANAAVRRRHPQRGPALDRARRDPGVRAARPRLHGDAALPDAPKFKVAPQLQLVAGDRLGRYLRRQARDLRGASCRPRSCGRVGSPCRRCFKRHRERTTRPAAAPMSSATTSRRSCAAWRWRRAGTISPASCCGPLRLGGDPGDGWATSPR